MRCIIRYSYLIGINLYWKIHRADDTDNMWNIISSCYSIDISTDRGEFQL